MFVQSESKKIEEQATILVADDEPVIREILCEFLSLEGHRVEAVEDGKRALEQLRTRPFDLVITDLKMPHQTGLDVLHAVRNENIPVPVILMTGFGTVETAITAMKQGAVDYILKPFKIDDVQRTIVRSLETRKLQSENIRLRESLNLYRVSETIARSLDLEEVLDVILNVALDESAADAVSLSLTQPNSIIVDRQIVKLAGSVGERTRTLLQDPDRHAIYSSFLVGQAVIGDRNSTANFFAGANTEQLKSFAAVPLRVSGQLIGSLHIYSFSDGKSFNEGTRKMLSVLASRAAMSIKNAQYYEDLSEKNQQLLRVNETLEESFENTIAAFAQALEESDQYTRGHSERVAEYSKLIAETIGMDTKQTRTVVRSGLLHDVGKLGIRAGIINKPGPLSSREINEFRLHPDKGRRILQPVPSLHRLIDGAWCHHESFDGSGYPRD